MLRRRLTLLAAVALLFTAWAIRPGLYIEQARTQAAFITEDQQQVYSAWQSIRPPAGDEWKPSDANRLMREVLLPWGESQRHAEDVMAGPLARYFPPALADSYRLRDEARMALLSAIEANHPKSSASFRRYARLWEEANMADRKSRAWLERQPDRLPVRLPDWSAR